jgi:predicted DNA-binding helix-hairpin-helix protein
MKRSYYSPFQPLKETPLENLDKPEPMRAPRLYQADYLINYYGFNLNELIFDGEGNLSVDEDPKYLMALNNPEKFPVEINSASFKELITVPGIGKISALRILHEKRRGHVFNKLEELKKLGAVIKRAEPFVKFKGVYQATLD